MLYLHGGGYVLGSARSHRSLAKRIAFDARARVVVPDYRLAPEHPFPAAVDDAVAAYRWLLASAGGAERIAVAGDSAGAGLALALLVSLRDAGAPLPACAVLLSPFADLECCAHSYDRLAAADPIVSREMAIGMGRTYVGEGGDAGHPLASPVRAKLDGLPPLLVQVGSREVVLDDAREIERRAREAGVAARLEVWDGMIHAWHLYAAALEDGRRAVAELAAFVRGPHEGLSGLFTGRNPGGGGREYGGSSRDEVPRRMSRVASANGTEAGSASDRAAFDEVRKRLGQAFFAEKAKYRPSDLFGPLLHAPRVALAILEFGGALRNLGEPGAPTDAALPEDFVEFAALTTFTWMQRGGARARVRVRLPAAAAEPPAARTRRGRAARGGRRRSAAASTPTSSRASASWPRSYAPCSPAASTTTGWARMRQRLGTRRTIETASYALLAFLACRLEAALGLRDASDDEIEALVKASPRGDRRRTRPRL